MTPENAWQPTCSLESLQARARLLQAIRSFFSERDVLEVETPLLGHCSGTDPQLEFFTSEYYLTPSRKTLFLQTSPEFAMKRLLAAGSGSIFQICKAFRNGESGRFHNPEFTMLEWYRVGFSLTHLMDEIDELINELAQGQLNLNPPQRFSYQDIFEHYTGLNPLAFEEEQYCRYAYSQNLSDAVAICGNNHALWLDLLFSYQVQPHLGKQRLAMVYGYPAIQSSLAKINPANPKITDRVEIFINGIELGNGYYELSNAFEQEKRFDREIIVRQSNSQPAAVKDTHLLAALNSGLPECSGMAIGLDRLLMLLSGYSHIDAVLAFPISRA